ncbi:MAG TPA: glycosyltransferase family 4 protein, partial [Pirellulales bacterium]|nr:glycosyltransferase family 4 protein [Pirellulales bacterium]
RESTVLFLSRMAAAKNPQVLLRAWRRLNAAGRYRLLMAGDGPLTSELTQYAAEQKLVNVEFFGQINDVPSAHRRASVFVLPSPSEGCSNALLEAMASGLCPVVTRVPGNIDVVRDGRNGLLFDHDDDEQLAAALARVLDDASLRGRLSAAARQQIVERHNLDDIAARFVALFRELLGNRKHLRLGYLGRAQQEVSEIDGPTCAKKPTTP